MECWEQHVEKNNLEQKWNGLNWMEHLKWNEFQQNGMLGTKYGMERFGAAWNGLEQNGRHGEGGSCS